MELFQEIVLNACRILPSFAPQNISNMVWSYATLGGYIISYFIGGFDLDFLDKVSCPSLFDKVVDEAIDRLETFNTQNISNLAWSFAQQQMPQSFARNQRLFREIELISLEKMEYFNERVGFWLLD